VFGNDVFLTAKEMTVSDVNPLAHAPPIGIAGLNSIMVYGENLQVAVGLNHQLAIGSNFQICINPAGLLASSGAIPGAAPFAAMLGSGIGGNVQLTIGTSASLVYGQAFDINLGPPKLELTGGKSNVDSYILCGLLGVAALVWIVVYASDDSAHARANEAIVFQAIFDVLLAGLMAVEMEKQQVDAEVEKKRSEWYKISPDPKERQSWPLEVLEAVATSAAILTVAVAPLVVVATQENQQALDKQKADEDQAKEDAENKTN
jgi:hypothetical protein